MAEWLRRNRGFLLFLLCLGFFRTGIADWNPIPSGSMRPTLLEGDVVLVNRVAYDFKVPLTDVALARLAEPHRGDVVTFTSPKNGTRLIKRIVAIPGDVVEMHDKVLYINGERAGYSALENVAEPIVQHVQVPAVRAVEQLAGAAHRVQFLTGRGSISSFDPITVPQDQYFMLGDNRDNSADSRFIGLVPRRLIIGRAHHLLLSADMDHWRLRTERTFSVIE